MRAWMLGILIAGCASLEAPTPLADAPGQLPATAPAPEVAQPVLVAAFDDGGRIRTLYPKAEQVARYGEVTVWRVAGGEVKWERLAALGRFSPVFGAGPHEWRALPGGVVVRLSPRIGPQAVDDWFRSRGLSAFPLAGGTQGYLVSTPAGLDALTVTERLARLPEVISASPNWWHPYSVRQ